ncbi:hypothetical protein BWZ20_02660 [Winogradskyella sp. J14-2]|uniref:hypothetical protein n=1 Tax=Winogradskyella sp. J14-2 TaxID=1936080 RepID=UPI000972E0BA|nr:hypothetical protein [Winogradskyella sp. J14-2]APY07268.1 hypothetical protein BWZ20_02660 [Winogradskyella sp. J14-2]
MKRILPLFAIILTLNFSFCQSPENKGTTTEEYNYMIRGYEMQLSSGLDMKSGYKVDHIKTITRSDYSFGFNALVRTKDNTLAGILIIATSEVSGRTYYLGMPINNTQLQQSFENDVKNWDERMTTAFAQALGELYANEAILGYKEAYKTE